MEINWVDIISLIIAIASFGYARIEKSKRMALWWTLKGLEEGAMSNVALYDVFIKKSSSDNRDSIPKEEFLTQLNNSLGHWRSHWELIKGIRYSADNKLATKEQAEKKAAQPPLGRA